MEGPQVKLLYIEAKAIAEELGITDEVTAGMNAPPYEGAFCWSLGDLMFVLNDEKDPSTELVNDWFTPAMVRWYYKQLEVMCG